MKKNKRHLLDDMEPKGMSVNDENWKGAQHHREWASAAGFDYSLHVVKIGDKEKGEPILNIDERWYWACLKKDLAGMLLLIHEMEFVVWSTTKLATENAFQFESN